MDLEKASILIVDDEENIRDQLLGGLSGRYQASPLEAQETLCCSILPKLDRAGV